MSANFGDFQNEVYAQAVQGVTTRYPFDFASIERKASEALPDWVYRYVSAAAGDGRNANAAICARKKVGDVMLLPTVIFIMILWPVLVPALVTALHVVPIPRRNSRRVGCAVATNRVVGVTF